MYRRARINADSPVASVNARRDGSRTGRCDARRTGQGAATAEPDFIVLNIVGMSSEACYQVGETFLNRQPPFNLAVGITKAIAGQIAIDRANVSNSKIGDIVIDISQLTSDERMRDGRIRSQWLESNKYPQAKLTNAKLVGLPARPYKDGEVLTFQIAGDLEVHGANPSHDL